MKTTSDRLVRDNRTELYRMFLMLGIVLLHTQSHAPVRHFWVSNALLFCVTGFVFISGYYGMTFKVGKIVRLYGMAFVCMAVVSAMSCWLGDGEWRDFAFLTFKAVKDTWFLHAYAALMLMVPMINAALERRGWETPFLVLSLGWSYLYDIRHLQPFVFPVSGLGSHTVLTLAGIYVAARVFRLRGLERQITARTALLLLPVLVAWGVIGLGRYNAPTSVALAGLLFVLFKRFAPDLKVAGLLAPSMFGVYLLHSADQSEAWTSQCVANLMSAGLNAYIAYVLAALATFVCAILVDVSRRVTWGLVRRGLTIKRGAVGENGK